MPEPVVTGSGQAVVSAGPELFVLPPPDLIDSFGEMFGDVKFVEDDLAPGFRQVMQRGVYVRVPRIHRYGAYRFDLLLAQR